MILAKLVTRECRRKGFHGTVSAIVGSRPNEDIFAVINSLKTARHPGTKRDAKTHRGNFCVQCISYSNNFFKCNIMSYLTGELSWVSI